MKKFVFISIVCLAVASCKNTDKAVVTETSTVVVKDSAQAIAETENVQDIQVSETSATDKSEEKTPVINAKTTDAKIQYASFGDKFDQKNVMTSAQMMEKYSTMKKGDTVNVRFASNIKEVCKKKGCWMSMQLPNGKESFVKFKDYGFFVPLNASKSDAIVNGKAFLDVVSVDDQKHYAKDGGKTDDEIAMITKPKITYGFTADGVLIKP